MPFERVQFPLRPRSKTLVAAMVEALSDGRLRPGEQLPTQRDLAYRLKIAVATVGRAYAELERLGLIEGQVGRGTYVREDAAAKVSQGARREPGEPTPPVIIAEKPRAIDMAVYRVPVPPSAGAALERVLATLAARDMGWLLGSAPTPGLPRHRATLAAWMSAQGVDVPAERVTITIGGQHATLAALATLTDHGDAIATEALTDPRMKAVASYLDRRLVAVACDGEGMLPDALEAVCRERRIAVVYCAPRLQNPFNTVLPLERRAAIAEVARRHNLQIVENDIYGTIFQDPLPPIQAIAPERTHYLTSLGRIAGPGMKVGCLVSPADLSLRTQAGVGATTGTSTLIAVELAASLVETGALAAMAAWQREENARRVALAARFEHFAGARLHPASPHLWLPLPDRWRAEDFVEAAARRGVAIAPTHGFMADRGSIPHAVRLCIGAPKDLATLETALGRLDRLMGSMPRSSVEAA